MLFNQEDLQLSASFFSPKNIFLWEAFRPMTTAAGGSEALRTDVTALKQSLREGGEQARSQPCFCYSECSQTWRKITYLFFPELMKHIFNHFTFNLHFWSEGKRVNSNTFEHLTLCSMKKWLPSLWICSASTEQQNLNLAFSVQYSSKTMYTTIHGLFIS